MLEAARRSVCALSRVGGAWRQWRVSSAATIHSSSPKRHCASLATNEVDKGFVQKQKITVTFVEKDGEEKVIQVPVGMSMLEAAHENDLELEDSFFWGFDDA